MPKVGEIYRDTYADKDRRNLRTIKITAVLPNGVEAEILTDAGGNRLVKPRITMLMIKTLRAGYELQAAS